MVITSASESPQVTILSLLMVTPYRPDIVIHNETCNSVALLELTDSMPHLEAARDRKQSKEEYLQILAEFVIFEFLPIMTQLSLVYWVTTCHLH